MGRHIRAAGDQRMCHQSLEGGMNLEKRWWEEIQKRGMRDVDENGVSYRDWLVIHQIFYLFFLGTDYSF